MEEAKGKLIKMLIENPFNFYSSYDTLDELIIPTHHKELDQEIFLDNIIEEDEIKRVAKKLDIEDEIEEWVSETKMIVPRTLFVP